jgi:hypothetical protein
VNNIEESFFLVIEPLTKMDKLNRVFERIVGMSYKKWHKTEFCMAEKKYAHAKRVYRHNPDTRDKWKNAKDRYKRAMIILETYEQFELELS